MLGNDYAVLTMEELDAYRKMKFEYDCKLAECEKMIQALQVDRAEYEYLKHPAETLVHLEKRLHNTDNASEIRTIAYPLKIGVIL